MRGLLLAGACVAAVQAVAQPPLPFALGGSFELVDQHGQTRTEQDPDGQHQLVFFGYANCPGICTAAMPLMAGVVDGFAAEGIAITPVMITVAPEVDRVDTMAAPLAEIHPGFVGLTGSPEALQTAYDAFSIEIEPLFEDPEHGTIYAHGSFIYLLDPSGEVLTLVPPIMDVDHTTVTLKPYLQSGS